MGNFMNTEVVELYQQLSYNDATIVYEAMDKTDYKARKEFERYNIKRYIDMDRMIKAVIQHKEKNKYDILQSIVMYSSEDIESGFDIKYNHYNLKWILNGKEIVTTC